MKGDSDPIQTLEEKVMIIGKEKGKIMTNTRKTNLKKGIINPIKNK
jgi:hypothetical protein